MEITYAPKEILQIDNARIIFRNFRGEAGKYNREGDRNFAVVIEHEEDANKLQNEGWNVKIRPPREEGDEPFMYLPVKVNFNGHGPNIHLISGARPVKLDEESVACLDDIDILNVNLDIRPYDWEVNDKTGRSAYLQAMEVTQSLDRFERRYSDDDPME